MSVEPRKEAGQHEYHRVADLHMHSTCSDGFCSPLELVSKAADAGLSAISITDHDSVSGIDEATGFGKEHGVTVIPGIEMNASLNGREIHIMGYFFDTANPELVATLSYLREQRLKRAERIVHKLNRLKIPITMESVLSHSGAGSVGRPHIARAMIAGGHAETYVQVFSKYLGDGCPAYERKIEHTPQAIISLIANAGGLSVLAHPGRTIVERDIITLIQAGIDGIEVVHPSHPPELVQYYRSIVNQYYLVESGGSDYHGGLRGDEHNFGQVCISLDAVEHMRRRLPMQFQ